MTDILTDGSWSFTLLLSVHLLHKTGTVRCYINYTEMCFAVLSCKVQSLSGAEAQNMVPAQAYNAEKAGAKAIIVADYKDERLLTMAVPEDRPEIAALKNDITIPTALITQVCCDGYQRHTEHMRASYAHEEMLHSCTAGSLGQADCC